MSIHGPSTEDQTTRLAQNCRKRGLSGGLKSSTADSALSWQRLSSSRNRITGSMRLTLIQGFILPTIRVHEDASLEVMHLLISPISSTAIPCTTDLREKEINSKLLDSVESL